MNIFKAKLLIIFLDFLFLLYILLRDLWLLAIVEVMGVWLYLCRRRMLMAGHAQDREKGRYTLIRDSDEGLYDKPLPCFGCGIGWFS